jgi:hypothetical protein
MSLIEDGEIEPVPQKRVFYSIIADYSLERSICELVDNAFDQWDLAGSQNKLNIQIDFDVQQQTILVTDNAAGVPREELEVLIGPGLTGNEPQAETIGYFGVGTKRAVVALAQDIKIRTRHGKEPTYMVGFDDTWLNDEDWSMTVYRDEPGIPESTTIISLSRLRLAIDEASLVRLREHLAATYALLLGKDVSLVMDGEPVKPHLFDDWAYPPGQPPRHFSTKLKGDLGEVQIELTAGLASESSPSAGDYGLFVYCNRRLVARGLRSQEVGFVRGLIGVPHPGIALLRVILKFRGPAQAMPWNSSKSGLNYNHLTFEHVRQWVLDVSMHYAKLSKNWQGEWPERVFKHKSGQIENHVVSDIAATRKSYHLKLPKFRKRKHEQVLHAHQTDFKQKPWLRGVVEGYLAAQLARKWKLDNANRFSLILLDSTLEIAMKDFLVHESGQAFSDAKLVSLFAVRHDVEAEVRKHITLASDVWKRVAYFYKLRCKLVHEKASTPISTKDVISYESTFVTLVQAMFGLKL